MFVVSCQHISFVLKWYANGCLYQVFRFLLFFCGSSSNSHVTRLPFSLLFFRHVSE